MVKPLPAAFPLILVMASGSFITSITASSVNSLPLFVTSSCKNSPKVNAVSSVPPDAPNANGKLEIKPPIAPGIAPTPPAAAPAVAPAPVPVAIAPPAAANEAGFIMAVTELTKSCGIICPLFCTNAFINPNIPPPASSKSALNFIISSDSGVSAKAF